MNVRNQVQLIGRLGGDPEIKKDEHGHSVVFQLAVKNIYINNLGQQIEEDMWFRIRAEKRLGERMMGLKKDYNVLVYGKLQNHSYDTENGTKKHFTSILAYDFSIIYPLNEGSKIQDTQRY